MLTACVRRTPPLTACPLSHQVLYSDSFRKQVQGKAAFVLDTPEMRRVRETQRIISGVSARRSSHSATTPSPELVTVARQVRYHEDFEKSKGSFTPTTSDLVTERVKKNTQDFSDISYRGIQRRVVEMERRRAIEHDQETITGTGGAGSGTEVGDLGCSFTALLCQQICACGARTPAPCSTTTPPRTTSSPGVST